MKLSFLDATLVGLSHYMKSCRILIVGQQTFSNMRTYDFVYVHAHDYCCIIRIIVYVHVSAGVCCGCVYPRTLCCRMCINVCFGCGALLHLLKFTDLCTDARKRRSSIILCIQHELP